MIECKLREFTEFHSVLSNYGNKKTRKGFYSHTIVPMRGLGRDKWLIVVHIDVDHEIYLSDGASEEDICCQCVDFLTQPPPRKKYAKKKPKPLYGDLTLYKAKFKEDEKDPFSSAEDELPF